MSGIDNEKCGLKGHVGSINFGPRVELLVPVTRHLMGGDVDDQTSRVRRDSYRAAKVFRRMLLDSSSAGPGQAAPPQAAQ